MNGRKERQDTLLNLDFEFDPSITQRVLAAIDRSEDPHLHIDILRRAIYQQATKISQLGSGLKLLQDSERERLTNTGVWTFVKAKLDAETAKSVVWAKRAALTGLGGAFLTGLGLLIKLAWKGLHAT